MEFKYNRDPEKTRKLLHEICVQASEICKTIKQQEPEHDPNYNLEFILNILNLVRQEGPVMQGVMSYLAECYRVNPEEMNRRCEKHNHRAIWCVDATAVAQFDTIDQAYREWERLSPRTEITVGQNKFWAYKTDIRVMPEDEFNKL